MLKSPAVIAGALALTLGSGVAYAANGERDLGRIAGNDRYTTAVAISQEAFPDGARAVYLARADGFADALAGSALANRGPVLLVPQCGAVPEAVIAEVNRLQPLEVQALGGPGAVCDAVLQQFAGATSDAPPGDDQVTLSGPGDQNSEAFLLDGGAYSVTYDLSGDCSYFVSLRGVDDDPFVAESIASGDGPLTGETNLFDLPNTEVFLSVLANNSTDCPYAVTLTSQ